MSNNTGPATGRYPTIVAEIFEGAHRHDFADSGVRMGRRNLILGAFVAPWPSNAVLEDRVSAARELLLNNKFIDITRLDDESYDAAEQSCRDFTASYWQLPSRRTPDANAAPLLRVAQKRNMGRDSVDLSYDAAPNLASVRSDTNDNNVWSPYMPHLIPPTEEDLAAGRDYRGNAGKDGEPAFLAKDRAVYSDVSSEFSPPTPISPSATSNYRTARNFPINPLPTPNGGNQGGNQ